MRKEKHLNEEEDEKRDSTPLDKIKLIKVMEIIYGEVVCLDLVCDHLQPTLTLLNQFSKIHNQSFNKINKSMLNDQQQMILSAILISEVTSTADLIMMMKTRREQMKKEKEQMKNKAKQKIITKEFIFQLSLIALFEFGVFAIKEIYLI